MHTKNARIHAAYISHFPGFISESNGVVLLVIDDVLIDSETLVVTSSISRCAGIVF